jgi:hypothetical protein
LLRLQISLFTSDFSTKILCSYLISPTT